MLDAGFEVARVVLERVRAPSTFGRSLARRNPAEVVPVIAEMVGAVTGERIDAHVQRLQDFGTRYAARDSAWAAAAYILDELSSYGIDSVAYHDWSNGEYAPNVVAVLPGTTSPDEIVVVGGHYDSYASGTLDDAPGADDNASGTALVLECARVLSDGTYGRTIVFISFGAEELGLIGSRAWVNGVAAANDLDIVAMLNADMIGYSQAPPLDMTLISEPQYPELRDLMVEVGSTYVPTLPLEDGFIPGGTSDHASFLQGGYHAIMFFEDSSAPCPFIHTNGDRVGPAYNTPLLAELTTRLAVAFMATVADPFQLAISHEPLPDTEDTLSPYRVVARVSSPNTLDPSSLVVHYTVSDFHAELPLVPTEASDEYEAFIPAQDAGHFVSYYIEAADTEGGRVTDPGGAPEVTHQFFVGAIEHLFADDFEAPGDWRTRVPGDAATSGLWTQEDPTGTGYGLGQLVQPEDDHTPAPGAVRCYVTGNASPGAPIGEADVDGGRTTLVSPAMDLSGHTNARLTYHRWFANSAAPTSGTDEWVVEVSADDGASWVEVERLDESRRRWERVERELTELIPLTSEVVVRFVASDVGTEDIVEAAVDDISVLSYQDPVPLDPEPPVGPFVGSERLVQIVPNPYGSLGAIRINVPEPARAVTLRIFDVAGRLVATLLDDRDLKGVHTVRWDGRDAAGRAAPSGTYFARLDLRGETTTVGFVMVR